MGNGMLSQEEIDALLRGSLEPDPPAEEITEDPFTDMEKDALGEIANISMGTAATTLSQLLGKKVEITTPKVDVTNSEQIRKDYPIPSLIVDVKYKAGLQGSNLLILSQRDGAVIVDLMMGGDGKNPAAELSELHISGISEAMNQMMGSAATSMSTMFSSMVDITPPQLVLNDMSTDDDIIRNFLSSAEPLVRISFRMVVESVIDSILVQVIPISVARGMVDKLMSGMSTSAAPPSAKEGAPQPKREEYSAPPSAPPAGEPIAAYGGSAGPYSQQQPMQPPPMMGPQEGYYAPPPNYSPEYAQQPGYPGYQPGYQQGYPPGYQQGYQGQPQGYQGQQGYQGIQGQKTSVQPAQFAPLQHSKPVAAPENLDLILDVPLQVSVELGRTKKTIKDILEMGPGSVVELDRLAGEPVDMIVNGKLVAKCEVVVINETFGIRITDIVQPSERMKTLN